MDAITYSAARANLASTMDRVCNDHEALIITRNGQQSVVMLSLEDFQRWKKQRICCVALPTPSDCFPPLDSLPPAKERNGNPPGEAGLCG